jgi:LacI family transcriptional regulator
MCLLLDNCPDLSAVFALSNQNALGALRAFAERKLKVPHDISLVTFDDAPFAEYLASPLSVVRQDIEGIGNRAAELLIEQIRTGHKPQQLLHRLPVQLILRDSIASPKNRHVS